MEYVELFRSEIDSKKKLVDLIRFLTYRLKIGKKTKVGVFVEFTEHQASVLRGGDKKVS